MFELSTEEFNHWRSQIAISNADKMGLRHRPYAFTEQGVAMPARLCHSGGLSSVLRSERAILVNIQIIRVYTRMKSLLLDNKDIWLKIEKIEHSLMKKDEEVQSIFRVLKQLLVREEKERTPIGFKIPGKK